MSHPRWPGFDDKTGDPRMDNDMRNFNRSMWSDAKRKIRFVGVVGRKRKKQLKRIEGGNYIRVVASVMNSLAKEAQRD